MTGYTFAGWFTEVATTTQFNFTTKITKDTTLYAKWTAVTTNTYTVMFDVDGGSPVDAIENVPHNTSITKPTDPTKANSRFVNWYKDTAKTLVFNFVTETITANITLAKWEVVNSNTFTVTFNLNYTPSTSITQTINSGTTATRETPTRTDYNFVDWFENENLTGVPFDFATEISADKTLYGKWTRDIVVTFNTLGGSVIAFKTVESGMISEPDPAPTRTHYTLEGWYENAELTGSKVIFPKTISTSITLYAKWTRIAYTVTFNLNYENAPNGGTEDSNQEGKVSKATPSRGAEYTFNGWFTADTGGTKVELTEKVFDAPITLYAQWTRETYRVTFNLNYESALDGGTAESNQEGRVTKAAPIRPNYTFNGWFTATTGGTKINLANHVFNSATTVYARCFFSITFALNYDSAPDGGKEFTNQENKVTKADPIRTYYIFNGWFTADIGGTKVELTEKVFDAPITLYAQWTRETYRVTFNLNYESALDGGTAESNQEGRVTKAAPIRPNYTFNGWFTAETGGTKVELAMKIFNSATTLYAQWTRKAYRVTYDLNYNNAPSGGTEESNQEGKVTKTNPSRGSDYTFMGWFTLATGGTQINLGTHIFDSATTLYARWQFSISFNENHSGAAAASSVEINPTTGKVTKTEPTRSGYAFNGWFTEATGGDLIILSINVFDTILTLYAHWKSEAKAHSLFVSMTTVASSIQLSITSSLALNNIGAVIRLASESVPTKTEAMASAGYVTLTVPANEARKFSISQHYGSVFTDGLTLADVLAPNTAYKLYLFIPANTVDTATTEITGITITNDVGVVEFTTESLPTATDTIWNTAFTANEYVTSLSEWYYGIE